jgi:hypothetical protein
VTDPILSAKLKRAGGAYKRARDRADKILAKPREDLTEVVREAYAAGVNKADILRGIDHAWSRQWVDDTTADIEPPGGRKRRPAKKDPAKSS